MREEARQEKAARAAPDIPGHHHRWYRQWPTRCVRGMDCISNFRRCPVLHDGEGGESV